MVVPLMSSVEGQSASAALVPAAKPEPRLLDQIVSCWDLGRNWRTALMKKDGGVPEMRILNGIRKTHEIIAGIWVAFFRECQQQSCADRCALHGVGRALPRLPVHAVRRRQEHGIHNGDCHCLLHHGVGHILDAGGLSADCAAPPHLDAPPLRPVLRRHFLRKSSRYC